MDFGRTGVPFCAPVGDGPFVPTGKADFGKLRFLCYPELKPLEHLEESPDNVLLAETVFDTLNVKAGLFAAEEIFDGRSADALATCRPDRFAPGTPL